jgi:hypothetical protein
VGSVKAGGNVRICPAPETEGLPEFSFTDCIHQDIVERRDDPKEKKTPSLHEKRLEYPG